MFFQWMVQINFLQDQIQCSGDLAVAVALFLLVGQLVGCVLVWLHLFINFAVTLLAGIVLLQVSTHLPATHRPRGRINFN